MKSHMGFRLAYLHLTLVYSEGRQDSKNGVSPNLLAFFEDSHVASLLVNEVVILSVIHINFTQYI